MSFIIETSKREGAKIVLGLAGTSGSGKTYSAIQLGYGLAGMDSSQLGFLDTENRRGRLYSDILPKPFMIADLVPPFSPERYIEGIRAFEKAGVRVLVIDSVTHEWEGIGGCEEIATAGDPKLPRWNKAKLEHKKFMNALLQSSMDIIVCLRAREKVDMKDPRNIKSLGIQPICEKNFMFEMTASVMLQDEGKRQTVLKCPESLRSIMGRCNDYLTAKDGQAIREWIDGGKPVNREIEHHRATLANACEWGLDALKAAWENLPKTAKHELRDELDQFKESAAAYDKQAAIVGQDDPAEREEIESANDLMKGGDK
jgi:hypothetical protein